MQDLIHLPFPHAHPSPSACSSLTLAGVHGKGPWRTLCNCFESADTSRQYAMEMAPNVPQFRPKPEEERQAADVSLAELRPSLQGWWGLTNLPFLSETNVYEARGWEGYYRGRGLDFDSPSALLMDAALTTAWAVRRYYTLFLDKQALSDTTKVPLWGQSLNVIVLGSSHKEVVTWPTFLEVANCLPLAIRDINVWLIGPEVPQWAHDCSVRVSLTQKDLSESREGLCKEQRHLTVHSVRGVYHEWIANTTLPPTSRPHVIMGLNAGLAAYNSWIPTLQLLHGQGKDAQMVCCFSDFNEEAVERSLELCRAVLENFENRCCPSIQMNPFRHPRLIRPRDNRLPAMRNGFLLTYHYE